MTSASPAARPSGAAIAVAVVAVAVALVASDLVFLGVVARSFYRDALGALERPEPYAPAAVAFYALYVVAIVAHAVVPSRSASDAARRGAALGLVAYGTYELTNWAVVSAWPARLVPVDLAWGVALTALVAAVGRAAFARASRGRA